LVTVDALTYPSSLSEHEDGIPSAGLRRRRGHQRYFGIISKTGKTDDVRPSQIDFAQVRTDEMRVVQVCLAEVCFLEVRPAELGSLWD
jgi:hypothetical protein